MASTQPRSRLVTDDSGMTLIEMVVAIGVLMTVLLSALSVFVTVANSQGVAEGTDRATQLAQNRIERIRQQDWRNIGFYRDTYVAGASATATTDTGTTASAYAPYVSNTGDAIVTPVVVGGSADPTIILGPTDPNAAVDRVKPYETTSATRNKFTVITTITWGRDTSLGLPYTGAPYSATNPYSYKRVRVTVLWKSNNTGANHTAVLESVFAPQSYDAAPPGVNLTTEN